MIFKIFNGPIGCTCKRCNEFPQFCGKKVKMFAIPEKILDSYEIDSISFIYPCFEMVRPDGRWTKIASISYYEALVQNYDNPFLRAGEVILIDSEADKVLQTPSLSDGIIHNYQNFYSNNNGLIVNDKVDVSRYPHKCPQCNGPAYIPLMGKVDCMKGC